MVNPNGYIQGKDGKPLELVDATARRQLAGKLDAPGGVKAGDYLRVQSVGADGTVVLEGAEGPGPGSGQNVAQMEPADGDTPLVFFTGVKPTTKDNVLAEMVYSSKGKIIKAYVKIKCQGSSSMSYPKKNFTVTLFQDEARTIPLYLGFKDWGIKVNKFVLKADWIDHSHSRNVCTARIWKDIVESRPDYDTLPEELKNAPGHGAIVGFPIAVYYNGNYEGIYNWNIGKDPWMWGMDENNPNHAMLCAEINNEGKGTATMCNFQGPLWGGIDGTGWSVEIGTNSTELKNSLNALISFVANSDEDAFVNGIEEYLDVQSAMDYYCLCYADCGLDGLGKNMTIGTYDGKKWYFGAYDLDCTWLLYWNGQSFVPADYRCPEDYQENANLLFDKFERYMTDRLRANYQRLRSGPLAESNVMPHFERYIGSIGSERYADDLAAYPAIPQGSNNNIRQIRAAVRDRFAFTDAEFAAMVPPVPCTGIALDKAVLAFDAAGAQTLTATVTPENTTDAVLWSSDNTGVANVSSSGVVTAVQNGTATITATCGAYSATCSVTVEGIGAVEPVYSLAEATTFDGVSDYVDTGVKLYDTEKDWTIFMAADFTQCMAAQRTALHCVHEVNPWPGVCIYLNKVADDPATRQYNVGGHAGAGAGQSYLSDMPATATKLAIRCTGGKIDKVAYLNAGEVKSATPTGVTYTAYDGTLLLGCYQDTSGKKDRFWQGSISQCDVYFAALSDDLISAFLS